MKNRKIWFALGLFAVFARFVLLTAAARAAENASYFYVDTTEDWGDWNPGDGKCEGLKNSGKCPLRAAVMEANLHHRLDVIILKNETYKLALSGKDGDNPYTLIGDIDITDSLDLRGAGSGITVVDGNKLDRVFDIHGQSYVEMSNMTIRNGDSGTWDGGAIRMQGVELKLRYVVVRDSKSYNGAIAHLYGQMTLYRVTVSSNIGQLGAGGIYASDTLLITDSTIYNNEGFRGGGIVADRNTLIVNSTISTNRAHYRGGGITYGSDWPGYLDLSNVTIHNNRANLDGIAGGGAGGVEILNNDPAYIRNSIIEGNEDEGFDTADYAGIAHDCHGKFTSEGFNLIGDGFHCEGVTNGVNGNKVGTTSSPKNAQLQSLAQNGGYTWTHGLGHFNPALDEGNPGGCFDKFGAKLGTDQRGYARPVDGNSNGVNHCDMGAYEYGSPGTPTPTMTKVPTNTPTPTATATSPSNQCSGAPIATTLLKPKANGKVKKTEVTLMWEGVDCVTKYKVQVKMDAKNGPRADKKALTGTSYTTKTLTAGHTYYWRVKACNGKECSKSNWFAFTIK